MDKLSDLLDELPLPIALYSNKKIAYANPALKNFLTQDVAEVSLTKWFSEIIKSEENRKNILNHLETKTDFTITTEAHVKGTVKHWIIASFAQRATAEDFHLMYFCDVTDSQSKKAYWDLHLRVSKATMQLLKEISERKKLEAKTAELNNQLILTARKAGMADVATSVLHNVGNILNSVKVSLSVLNENIKKIQIDNLSELMCLILDHINDLSDYFNNDTKGKLIPRYLNALAKSLPESKEKVITEIKNLFEYTQHIEEIVALQGSIGGKVNVAEKILLSEIIENALQLCKGALESNHIEIQKKCPHNLYLVSDKFKILQIIVNLIQNAKDALILSEHHIAVMIIAITVTSNDDFVEIIISDNGVGIDPENITNIFSVGFTTKPHGHGYGLHSSALAAKELGGSLYAKSEGNGKGASFILTLPLDVNHCKAATRKSEEQMHS